MEDRYVVVRRFGDPSTLEFAKRAPTPPPPGEVRVRTTALGVAFGDVLRRRGLVLGKQPLPFTPGYDVVGVVEAVGENVTNLHVGDRVAAFLGEGGYSESVLVRADRCATVPDSVRDDTAVCLVLNYVSALQMLRTAQLRGPSRILVHGATGGVGTALVELARLDGHVVFGTASKAKHPALERLGGTPIDYRESDFVQVIRDQVPDGLDAVFDGIGGKHLCRSTRVVHRHGHVVAYGFSSALTSGLAAVYQTFAQVLSTKLNPWAPAAHFYGVSMPPHSTQAKIHADIRTLLALAEQGSLRPLVCEVLPFAEVARAHELLESGGVVGKLVLRPSI